jgi:hypothetical protein
LAKASTISGKRRVRSLPGRLASTSVAYAADESDPPPPPRFRPWQQVWQCNDIRVTITARDPFSVEYDLGGTIWGGSRFTIVKGELWAALFVIATGRLLR